jgi:hypothetical protein
MKIYMNMYNNSTSGAELDMQTIARLGVDSEEEIEKVKDKINGYVEKHLVHKSMEQVLDSYR